MTASKRCCRACPTLARALIKCDGASHRCSLPICAVCARAYRQGPIAQLHALANAYAGPHEVATDLPRPIRAWLSAATQTSRAPTTCSGNVWTAGGLQGRDRCGRRLRRLGRRTGSVGSCMSKCSASASTRTAWEQLEAALQDSGTAKPVEVVGLRDPDEQLSYCIKFVTYHQPGRRLVPLPPDRLVELAAWWSQHRFEDFLFAYGARRRGGRLVVDN